MPLSKDEVRKRAAESQRRRYHRLKAEREGGGAPEAAAPKKRGRPAALRAVVPQPGVTLLVGGARVTVSAEGAGVLVRVEPDRA